MSGLHSTQLGHQGPWVVFCHGLFGQGKNWTQVAKAIAGDHRALLLDMPDHGQSPWTDGFDYLASADLVADQLAGLDGPVDLVGHSMGGKIAMLVALRRPELVRGLSVVDVAPAAYSDTGGFAGFVAAMRSLDLDALERRADADAGLTEAVPDPTVRSFLLQNLRREGDHWRWQPNLDGLEAGLTALRGWPAERLGDVAPYDGPVLWVRGAESGYVRDEHAEAMRQLFPRVRRVAIKDAGHWVHAEQPAVFVEILRHHLSRG